MTVAAQLSSLLATIDSSTPSFTLFEVADGVRLLPPPVDGVAALLVLAGTMQLAESELHEPVPAGWLTLLPSGCRAAIATAADDPLTTVGRHQLIHRQGWTVADATKGHPATLIVAAVRIAGSGGDTLDRPIVVPLIDSACGQSLFDLIRTEWSLGRAGHPALAMSLMSACVVQALRHLLEATTAQASDGDTAAHGLIARAVAAIRARPADAHTVATLADLAGMSRSTFIRHFRRLMRTTPIEYVQRVRLDEARLMLGATRLPVKTVAAQTGFASRSHFSRLFRTAYGRDPTAFRQGVEQDVAR